VKESVRKEKRGDLEPEKAIKDTGRKWPARRKEEWTVEARWKGGREGYGQ